MWKVIAEKDKDLHAINVFGDISFFNGCGRKI
jgi:hypothetical protein